MRKRKQIGFIRRHKVEPKKEEKKEEKKEDIWDLSFKKDNWEFGKDTAPTIKNLYKGLNEKD